jgi:hypothetical protein
VLTAAEAEATLAAVPHGATVVVEFLRDGKKHTARAAIG